MNIVLAIQDLNVGGAERQVLELSTGLKTLGHNVTICCLNTRGVLAEEAMGRGIEVVCLNKKHKYDFRIIFRLVKLLKQKKADVLQTYLFGADLWGRLAGRLAGVKVLLTSNRSGGRHYEKKEYWFDRLLWPLADGIISNTQSGRELLHHKLKIPLEKLYFVPNGYNFNKFNNLPARNEVRRELSLSDSDYVAVITGSLKPIKNHKMLIEAAKVISKKYNNIRYLIVGKGPLEKELIALVENYGLKKQIIFTGQRLDIPRLLSSADMGVLTSKWEGYSNSIMEYMVAGLPVVATDVGGVRDLVSPDKTGYLVPSGDAPAMAQKIVELFNAPEKAEEMGRAGKEWVHQNCDFQILALKVTEICDSIVKRK
jgi:glycosyltransferase involved in cell wall biosynthesis